MAEHAHHTGCHHHGPAKHRDPVCGMMVDPAAGKPSAVHEGVTYHFCGAGCRTKFVADPAKYLAPKAPVSAADTQTIHTCPMHPEVRQRGPGSCPICGMALEPLEFSAVAAPNAELIDMTRRFWLGLALALPVVMLDMAAHVPGLEALVAPMPMHLRPFVAFAFATPVVFGVGWPLMQRFWQSLRNRSLNMFSLIGLGLGVGVAYAYSLVATVVPNVFPPAFRDAHGMVAVYYEAASVITVLVLLGQVLELRARASTGDALRALLNLAPKTAFRVGEGADIEIPLENVQLGDRPDFLAKLIAQLDEVRRTTGRPHWLVLDEAHHLLPAARGNAHVALPRHDMGQVFVTLEPRRLAQEVLDALDVVVAVSDTAGDVIGEVAAARNVPPPTLPPGKLERGEAFVWRTNEQTAVRVKIPPSEERHRRHVRKYVEGHLAPEGSFYFRGPDDKLNLRADNLQVFLQMAEGVDDATWLHHLQAGDYSRWFANIIKNDDLASETQTIETEGGLDAATSRDRIRAAIERRYIVDGGPPVSAPQPSGDTRA